MNCIISLHLYVNYTKYNLQNKILSSPQFSSPLVWLLGDQSRIYNAQSELFPPLFITNFNDA
jgi:hypothetical protein